MALPQPYVEKDWYTEDEYLTWEADALTKSEYVRGQICAMAGGTNSHAALAFSISLALGTALRGSVCRGYSSDMKVRTGKGSFRYPDVSVVCGKSEFYNNSRSVITNPLLVVEVLSPGTEATDRGAKLAEYQATDSVQSILLVSSDSCRVEQYARKENGHWDYQAVTEGGLHIPALDVTLALSDLYDGIEFGDTDYA